MRKARSKPTKRHGQSRRVEPKKTPFIEHIYELRKRLFYIALSIIGAAGLAFYFQKQLLAFLRWPAGDQIFVTTTPGGAFNFLFTICIATGVVVSIPVIVYQVLRYTQPVIKDGFMRTLTWGSITSGLLAVAGVAFGYVYGLPNSLRFLFGQSTNLNVEAMITIDSYASFVTMYLLGAALLFQVPLVLLLINRIKPLTPSQLFKYERPFIVGSAIMGAIISPSPNVGDMLVLTIPMIIMYQISMVIIWVVNRKHRRPHKVSRLLKKDTEIQTQRLISFREAKDKWQEALQAAKSVHTHTDTAHLARPVMAAAVSFGGITTSTPTSALLFQRTPTHVAPQSSPSNSAQPTLSIGTRPTIRRPYTGRKPLRPNTIRRVI